MNPTEKWGSELNKTFENTSIFLKDYKTHIDKNNGFLGLGKHIFTQTSLLLQLIDTLKKELKIKIEQKDINRIHHGLKILLSDCLALIKQPTDENRLKSIIVNLVTLNECFYILLLDIQNLTKDKGVELNQSLILLQANFTHILAEAKKIVPTISVDIKNKSASYGESSVKPDEFNNLLNQLKQQLEPTGKEEEKTPPTLQPVLQSTRSRTQTAFDLIRNFLPKKNEPSPQPSEAKAEGDIIRRPSFLHRQMLEQQKPQQLDSPPQHLDPRLELYERLRVALFHLSPFESSNNTDDDNIKTLTQYLHYFVEELESLLNKDTPEVVNALANIKNKLIKESVFLFSNLTQSNKTKINEKVHSGENFLSYFDELTNSLDSRLKPYVKDPQKLRDANAAIGKITREDIGSISIFFNAARLSTDDEKLKIKKASKNIRNVERKTYYKNILNNFNQIIEKLDKRLSAVLHPRPHTPRELLSDSIKELNTLFHDWFLTGFINSSTQNLREPYKNARTALLNFFKSEKNDEQIINLNEALQHFYSLLDIVENAAQVKSDQGWQFHKNAFSKRSDDKENKVVRETLLKIKGKIENIKEKLPHYSFAQTDAAAATTPAPPAKEEILTTSLIETPNFPFLHKPTPYLQPNEDAATAKNKLNQQEYKLTPHDIETAWEVESKKYQESPLPFLNLATIEINNANTHLPFSLTQAEQTTPHNLLLFKILKSNNLKPTKEWALLAALPEKNQFVYFDPSSSQTEKVPESLTTGLKKVYPEAVIEINQTIHNQHSNLSGCYITTIARQLIANAESNSPQLDKASIGPLIDPFVLDNVQAQQDILNLVKDNISLKIDQEYLEKNQRDVIGEIKSLLEYFKTSEGYKVESFHAELENLFNTISIKEEFKDANDFIRACGKLLEPSTENKSKILKLTVDKLIQFKNAIIDHNDSDEIKAKEIGREFERNHKPVLQQLQYHVDTQQAIANNLLQLRENKKKLLEKIAQEKLNPENEETKKTTQGILNDFARVENQLLNEFLVSIEEPVIESFVTPDVHAKHVFNRQTSFGSDDAMRSDNEEISDKEFEDNKTVYSDDIIIPAETPHDIVRKKVALNSAAEYESRSFLDKQALKEITLENQRNRKKAIVGFTTTTIILLLVPVIATMTLASSGALLPFAITLTTFILGTVTQISGAVYFDRQSAKFDKELNALLSYFIFENAPITQIDPVTGERKQVAGRRGPRDTFNTDHSSGNAPTRQEVGEAILYKLLFSENFAEEKYRVPVLEIIHKLIFKIESKNSDQQPEEKAILKGNLENMVRMLATHALLGPVPGSTGITSSTQQRITQLLEKALTTEFRPIRRAETEHEKQINSDIEAGYKIDQIVLWLNSLYNASAEIEYNAKIELSGEPNVKYLKPILLGMKKENLRNLIQQVDEHPKLNPVVRLLLTILRPITMEEILARRFKEINENLQNLDKDNEGSSANLIKRYNWQQLESFNKEGLIQDLNTALDVLNVKEKPSLVSANKQKAYLTAVVDVLIDLQNTVAAHFAKQVESSRETEPVNIQEKSDQFLADLLKGIKPANLGKLFTNVITRQMELNVNNDLIKKIIVALGNNPAALQTALLEARKTLGSSPKFIAAIKETLFTLDHPDIILTQLLSGFESQHIPFLNKTEVEETLLDILTAHDELHRLQTPPNYEATSTYIRNITNLRNRKHFKDYYVQSAYFIISVQGRIPNPLNDIPPPLDENAPSAKAVRKAFGRILPEEISEHHIDIIKSLFSRYPDDDNRQISLQIFLNGFAQTKVDRYSLEMRLGLIATFFANFKTEVPTKENTAKAIAKWFLDMEENPGLIDEIEKEEIKNGSRTHANTYCAERYASLFATLGPDATLTMLSETERYQPGLAGKIIYRLYTLPEGQLEAENENAINNLLVASSSKPDILASLLGHLYTKAKQSAHLSDNFNRLLSDFLSKIQKIAIPENTLEDQMQRKRELRAALLRNCILSVCTAEQLSKKEIHAILKLLFNRLTPQAESQKPTKYIHFYKHYLFCYSRLGNKSARETLTHGFEQAPFGELFSINEKKPDYDALYKALYSSNNSAILEIVDVWFDSAAQQIGNNLSPADAQQAGKCFTAKLLTTLLHAPDSDDKIIAILENYVLFIEKLGITNPLQQTTALLALIEKHATKEQVERLYRLISQNSELLRNYFSKQKIATILKEELVFHAASKPEKVIISPQRAYAVFFKAPPRPKEGTDDRDYEISALRNNKDLNNKLASLAQALGSHAPEDNTNYFTNIFAGITKDKLIKSTKILIQAIALSKSNTLNKFIEQIVGEMEVEEVPLNNENELYQSILEVFVANYSNLILKEAESQNLTAENIKKTIKKGRSKVTDYITSERLGIDSKSFETMAANVVEAHFQKDAFVEALNKAAKTPEPPTETSSLLV